MSTDSDFAEIQRLARSAKKLLRSLSEPCSAHASLDVIDAIASAQVMLSNLAAGEALGCAGCCNVEDCPCTKICDETYCDKHFKEEYDRRFPRAVMDSDDKRSDFHERTDER